MCGNQENGELAYQLAEQSATSIPVNVPATSTSSTTSTTSTTTTTTTAAAAAAKVNSHQTSGFARSTERLDGRRDQAETGKSGSEEAEKSSPKPRKRGLFFWRSSSSSSSSKSKDARSSKNSSSQNSRNPPSQIKQNCNGSMEADPPCDPPYVQNQVHTSTLQVSGFTPSTATLTSNSTLQVSGFTPSTATLTSNSTSAKATVVGVVTAMGESSPLYSKPILWSDPPSASDDYSEYDHQHNRNGFIGNTSREVSVESAPSYNGIIGSILDITPVELAHALTLRLHYLFCTIPLPEFVVDIGFSKASSGSTSGGGGGGGGGGGSRNSSNSNSNSRTTSNNSSSASSISNVNYAVGQSTGRNRSFGRLLAPNESQLSADINPSPLSPRPHDVAGEGVGFPVNVAGHTFSYNDGFDRQSDRHSGPKSTSTPYLDRFQNESVR